MDLSAAEESRSEAAERPRSAIITLLTLYKLASRMRIQIKATLYCIIAKICILTTVNVNNNESNIFKHVRVRLMISFSHGEIQNISLNVRVS